MKNESNTQNNFPASLRMARRARGLTQEAFDLTSSRTYISALERGLKSPTLSKVDELAAVLGLHPLTVLALAYVKPSSEAGVRKAIQTIEAEMLAIIFP